MGDVVVARRALLALVAALSLGACPMAGFAARGAQYKQNRLRAIAIDPGHGGVDPGAISPHGVYEKTVTLATARELARQLEATGRYRPVLTRHGDKFVPLRERVARAREGRCDLFLSIHADALPNTALRGLSVYTLSDQASDREAAALAVRENRDDFVAGVHLMRQPPMISAILLDLARRQTNNESLLLARSLVTELGRDVPLLEKPHRAAGFVVLTAPDMPSALVELGCLSNPEDEHLLQQRTHQQHLARGLVHAIEDYFAAVMPS
jgi:N-acetylmuramoyl-L-alanine amidase